MSDNIPVIAQNIPAEILESIFEYVSIFTPKRPFFPGYLTDCSYTNNVGISDLALVARSWREPAQRILFRRIYIHSRIGELERFFNVLKYASFGKHVKCLHILDSSRETTDMITIKQGKFMAAIIERCPNLRQINLAPRMKTSLLEKLLFRKSPQVVSTEIYIDRVVSPLRVPDSVKELELTIRTQLDALPPFPSSPSILTITSASALTTLVLRITVSSASIPLILDSVASRLENFSLIREDDFNSQDAVGTFTPTLPFLKCLEYLVLDNQDEEMHIRYMKQLLPNFKQLEVLSLESEMHTDHLLSYIPSTIRVLELMSDEDWTSILDPFLENPDRLKTSLKLLVIMYGSLVRPDLPEAKYIDFLEKKGITLELRVDHYPLYEFFRLCKFSFTTFLFINSFESYAYSYLLLVRMKKLVGHSDNRD